MEDNLGWLDILEIIAALPCPYPCGRKIDNSELFSTFYYLIVYKFAITQGEHFPRDIFNIRISWNVIFLLTQSRVMGWGGGFCLIDGENFR